MNKTLRYICFILAIGVMVAVFVGRVKREDTDPEAVPRIDRIVTQRDTLKISELRGRYVLVNYWDSHNAISRIAAGEYDRFVREHPSLPLILISVNTDSNRELFDEIVAKDSLDRATQYHVSDARRGKSVVDFTPDEGYASYLLSPDGKLETTNPTVEELSRLVK